MLIRKPLTLPVGGYSINRAHPRAQGLCFFAPLRDAYSLQELHSGRTMTPTGLSSRLVTRAGAALSFGASNYADFTKPPEIGATTPFTLAWSQEARSTSAAGNIVRVNFGTGGVNNPLVTFQHATDATYYWTAGPQTTGGAHSWSAAIGAVTNNRLDRFVLRAAAGSQSTTGSNWSLHRNGQLVTRGTSTDYTPGTATVARIGANASGADVWEGAILDVRLWARVLSDDEAQRESVQDLIGELYEPRRILIPVSAAAPSGFLPAWIRRPQRTIGAGVI